LKHSPKQIQKVLYYDFRTGLLWWRERASGRQMNRPVGSPNSDGYLEIHHGENRYKAHILVWVIIKGVWPEKEIDHCDGVKTNNLWCNLRLATRAQQMHNTGRYANNTSGFKGVSFHKVTGLWQSRIMIGGKNIQLGFFKTPESAFSARQIAAKKWHKEFARS